MRTRLDVAGDWIMAALSFTVPCFAIWFLLKWASVPAAEFCGLALGFVNAVLTFRQRRRKRARTTRMAKLDMWTEFDLDPDIATHGKRQEQLSGPPHCRKCEYNLTGNTSGVCPECGSAVPEQAVPIPPAGKTKDGL
jgi:predicted Zn-ribbon and HTH transcriptional regulator